MSNGHGELSSYTELATILDTLPLLLREARRARGLSLRAAAQQIGVGFSTLTRMESGAGYHIDAAGLILRWLDTRPVSS